MVLISHLRRMLAWGFCWFPSPVVLTSINVATPHPGDIWQKIQEDCYRNPVGREQWHSSTSYNAQHRPFTTIIWPQVSASPRLRNPALAHDTAQSLGEWTWETDCLGLSPGSPTYRWWGLSKGGEGFSKWSVIAFGDSSTCHWRV